MQPRTKLSWSACDGWSRVAVGLSPSGIRLAALLFARSANCCAMVPSMRPRLIPCRRWRAAEQ